MRRSLAVVFLCGLLAAPLQAITVVPMSFEELVTASAAVVYARVSEVKGQWTADRQGIESLVTLDVLTTFKGSPGATVAFSVPGGQAGRYLNLLPGAPSFAEGDLVVVFLTSRGPRVPITTGFTQGVYRVTRSSSGAMVVIPPIVEAAIGRVERGDPQRRPLTLPAFESAVRAVHEGPR